MSTHQFVFPPPPPPPSQSVSTYNHFPGPSNGGGASIHGRGNRGDRGFQNQGRGQGNGSRSRNHSSGYQGANGYQTSRESFRPPSSTNGYPLPEYPSLQQSQNPTTHSTGYNPNPSIYPPAIAAPSNDRPYFDSTQNSPQTFGNNVVAASYSHNSQSYSTSYGPPGSTYYGPGPLRPEIHNQSMVSGPPLRMGFQGYQQNHMTTQQFPPPISIGPNLSLLDPLANSRPSFRPAQSNYHSQRDSRNYFPGHRSRGQKRGHQDAFSKPQLSKSNVKTQVAPPVPSFGIPLPVKPPAPLETGRRRKKKRRHNQLGLTPKTVEHESSEEEGNDVDEEAKLAVAAGFVTSESQSLQFTYRGHTSTLQSTSDIASWIEERKKRFPTKNRIAEKAERARQIRQEMQAARRERLSLAKQNAVAKAKEKVATQATRKAELKDKRETDAKIELGIKNEDVKENSPIPNDPAEKAKLKMEKLQRRLEKVEKRAARAAAEVSKLKAEASQYEEANQIKTELPKSIKMENDEGLEVATIPTQNLGLEIESGAISIKQENIDDFGHTNGELSLSGDQVKEAVEAADELSRISSDLLTPTSQPCIPSSIELKQEREAATTPGVPGMQAVGGLELRKDGPGDLANPTSLQKPEDGETRINVSVSTLSSSSSTSSMTESEDASSSDGSTSSSALSSVPDSRPSKRVDVDRVAPPKRAQKKAICRNFLHHGRCRKGEACTFRHELPDRGTQGERHHQRVPKPIPGEDGRKRIGLFQRLVEQERAQEASQSRNATAEAGNDMRLDEAGKAAIPATDEVAAS